jgi:hypothetical protein
VLSEVAQYWIEMIDGFLGCRCDFDIEEMEDPREKKWIQLEVLGSSEVVLSVL